MEAVIDNDILFKGACYGLLEELLPADGSITGPLGILGAARYVVAKKIQKSALRTNATTAIKELEAFLERAETVEPTENEQLMAADFELAAQRTAVALDSGESQLCAVVIARALPLLLTGDKRAIKAIERLLDVDPRLQFLCGKIKCLEQLVLRSLSEENHSRLRAAVCGEPDVDKALAICFSCKNEAATLEGISEGLRSYINDLRSGAPQVLAA
ncbi:MAG TPA: hypothetical protein VEW46_16080 [Pyrinomonadaceae bacterium]|nr:hypothetical protein [Pyrinomonadaceae bacterium]